MIPASELFAKLSHKLFDDLEFLGKEFLECGRMISLSLSLPPGFLEVIMRTC